VKSAGSVGQQPSYGGHVGIPVHGVRHEVVFELDDDTRSTLTAFREVIFLCALHVMRDVVPQKYQIAGCERLHAVGHEPIAPPLLNEYDFVFGVEMPSVGKMTIVIAASNDGETFTDR
jgi:hypothetical protein